MKPSNIGFASDGQLKLMDFGVAALAGDGNVAAGGTPLYLSPERVMGLPPDFSADLWAMAVVLWESLAGRHPFSGVRGIAELQSLIAAGPPDLLVLRPGCPPGVARALERAMSPDRALRPTSGQVLSEMVAAGAAG